MIAFCKAELIIILNSVGSRAPVNKIKAQKHRVHRIDWRNFEEDVLASSIAALPDLMAIMFQSISSLKAADSDFQAIGKAKESVSTCCSDLTISVVHAILMLVVALHSCISAGANLLSTACIDFSKCALAGSV